MSKTNSAVKLTHKARPTSKEIVILFGTEADTTLKDTKRIITNGGRRVEFKNLATQIIGQ